MSPTRFLLRASCISNDYFQPGFGGRQEDLYSIRGMVVEMAEARGRVTIRPWRIGLVIDTSSPAEVRAAIAELSAVWGGMSMPILDQGCPIEDLKRAARAYDVDSLFATNAEGALGDLLTRPGWAWRGAGMWGPFGSDADEFFRKGLLQTRALVGPAATFVTPVWDADDPLDLALAAIWGLESQMKMSHGVVPLDVLLGQGVPDGTVLGAIGATMAQIALSGGASGRTSSGGIHVLRPRHAQDAVSFWNLRSYGSPVIGIPAEARPGLADLLLSPTLPITTWTRGDTGAAESVLQVFGLEHASAEVVAAIRAAAEREGAAVEARTVSSLPLFIFGGVETKFRRTVRVDFRPDARWVDVDLPTLPLADDPSANQYARGIVAAQLELQTVQGQDPRFTTVIPPHRQHSALLQNLPFLENVDHVRSSSSGLVLGVDASVQDVRAPFAYNVDVLRALFDDDSATADQTDVGKFQTRAAEKFGGPFSGIFSQPGVRAAVALAAGKPAGVTLPHLRGVVAQDRGGWPGSITERKTTPSDYAKRAVNELFHSGLFVPTLKVHCSHCRVESFVSADQLQPTMHCEFCGSAFNLALSHGLSRPEWRYRLAAHLRADQIEALLPALATTSLLQQFRFTPEPVALSLGFRIEISGRTIEADVAAYLPDPDWLIVLGEVKNANRIDENDVANLEYLRDRLKAVGVRCLLLFATLKDKFSVPELSVLRGLAERSGWATTHRGQSVADLPLVLTAKDLSRHFWDEGHPWHWKTDNNAGIFDKAQVSCERNLGLRAHEASRDADRPPFEFEWATDQPEPLDDQD